MKKRAVVSYVMFFCLLALVPSGIMLHVTESDASDRMRDLFMAVHNISGIILVISVTLHLVFNFTPMTSYLKSKSAASAGHGRGVVIALSIVAVLLVAAILHVLLNH